MSKIYKLSLKQKSGLLSELQSDTIFGHFCWRLKDKYGEETLKNFLHKYSVSKPVFTISNGMLEKNGVTYFNKPKMQTPFKYEVKTKKDRIKDSLLYKELRSRDYITLEQLNLFLNNKVEDYNKSFESPADIPKMFSEVRVNIQIDRQTSGSAEGKLFNLNPSYSQDQSTIAVFVKEIDDKEFENYKVIEILKSVFEIGYGKKKSSGFGEFEVGPINEINNIKEPANSNGFISFSNYLPSNDDKIANAFYDINVKYGKFGEEHANINNPFKKPIVFLTAGSCFVTDIKQDYYGRCTDESEISDYFPKAIQNGVAFSLNFKLV
ncbi:MAG: RAMP superfamily CRISPR-associated protein [Ignavibacteriaceae bacterium]